MILENKKIAIVGGGPGGLTLARLLQMAGAQVTVYERDLDRNVRVQGATLDLHYESGLEALRRAGLMDAFKAAYRPDADKMRLSNGQAQVLYDQHDGDSDDITFGHEHFRPEIDRGPLRELLLDSLQPGTVVWDSRLSSLEPAGRGWTLRFHNGHTAEADLVIGADGANSKIRSAVTDLTPIYSGVSVVEGSLYDAEKNAPRLHALVNGGKVFAMHNAQTLILSAKGDGSLAFYTGSKMPEHALRDSGVDFADPSSVLAWFKREFAGWSDIWQELFQNEKTRFVPRPQYYMPPDATWETRPDITLIGDAAHVMPPFAGEGVNMAMLDAVELAACLTDERYNNLPQALAAYEKGMHERMAGSIRETLEQTEALHSPQALANMLQLFA